MPDEKEKERVQITAFFVDAELAADIDRAVNQIGLDSRVAFCRLALRQAVRRYMPMIDAVDLEPQKTTTPIG